MTVEKKNQIQDKILRIDFNAISKKKLFDTCNIKNKSRQSFFAVNLNKTRNISKLFLYDYLLFLPRQSMNFKR